MEDNKEIRIATPEEKLADIVLESIARHQYYMRMVRMGGDTFEELENTTDNDRQQIKARSLIRVVSIQRELLLHARPIVHHLEYSIWEKGDKTKPFEEDDNDYNNLLLCLKFLKHAGHLIRTADLTKTLADDFLIWKQTADGEKEARLTNNFYNMVDELEDCYEEIYKIMLTNGILTPTITQSQAKLKSSKVF
jgi:hypothetical protein